MMSVQEWKSQFTEDNWMTANARIAAHPEAALYLIDKFSAKERAHARRTIVCAAGFNTPLWQEAVAATATA